MKEIKGNIVKIENTEEPPLIHIKTSNGMVNVYSLDDIKILEQDGDKVTIEPFERDKK